MGYKLKLETNTLGPPQRKRFLILGCALIGESESLPAFSFISVVCFVHRELVLCTLAALLEEFASRRSNFNSLDCLDGFAATGIMSCQWLKTLGRGKSAQLAVYATERQQSTAVALRRSVQLNGVRLLDLRTDQLAEFTDSKVEENELHFLQEDVAAVLLKKSFDFVHLDPFGSTVLYLEAAFRNLRQGGVLTLTNTDVSSLFARAPNVVWRNYGARILKTSYSKELAVRVVLSSVVRAAARCAKGIRVLFTVAQEHFLLCAVQVVRGTTHADACSELLQPLLHCRMCEQRAFLPACVDGVAPLTAPYDALGCTCHLDHPGRTAVILGPCWAGPLFSADFLRSMAKCVPDLHLDDGGRRLASLLRLLVEESECVLPSQAPFKQPAFFCSPTRLQLHNVDLPK